MTEPITDRLARLAAGRRVAALFWLLNLVLVVALLAFALR